MQGTWEFQSLESLLEPGRRQTLLDDVESLLYVVLYCAFLWLPHNLSANRLSLSFALIFEYRRPAEDGEDRGGDGKITNAYGRKHTHDVEFSPALKHWVAAMMQLFRPLTWATPSTSTPAETSLSTPPVVSSPPAASAHIASPSIAPDSGIRAPSPHASHTGAASPAASDRLPVQHLGGDGIRSLPNGSRGFLYQEQWTVQNVDAFWANFLKTYSLEKNDRTVNKHPRATGVYYADLSTIESPSYGVGVVRKRDGDEDESYSDASSPSKRIKARRSASQTEVALSPEPPRPCIPMPRPPLPQRRSQRIHDRQVKANAPLSKVDGKTRVTRRGTARPARITRSAKASTRK